MTADILLNKNFELFKNIVLTGVNTDNLVQSFSAATGWTGTLYPYTPMKAEDGSDITSIRNSSGYSSQSPAFGWMSMFAFQNNNQVNNCTSFKVGSGDTAPDASDYCLESPITAIHAIRISGQRTLINGNPVCEFYLKITNADTSDIEVSEVGIFKNSTTSSWEYSYSTTFMIGRGVLSQPLVIHPQETKDLIIRFSI